MNVSRGELPHAGLTHDAIDGVVITVEQTQDGRMWPTTASECLAEGVIPNEQAAQLGRERIGGQIGAVDNHIANLHRRFASVNAQDILARAIIKFNGIAELSRITHIRRETLWRYTKGAKMGHMQTYLLLRLLEEPSCAGTEPNGSTPVSS